jgi:hypothetical protein
MHDGIDARGKDLQPKPNSNSHMMLYFVALVLFSHIFLLSMFIGVIFERFNRTYEKRNGILNQSVKQRRWIDVQKMMIRQDLKKKEHIQEGKVCAIFQKIAENKWFELFILFVIFSNAVVLSLTLDKSYEKNLNIASTVFTAIYNVEAVIKLVGLGQHYFDKPWNCFDFFVVTVSDIGLIVTLINPYIDFSQMTVVLRALRLMRVFKIVSGFETINLIMNALQFMVQPILSMVTIGILTNFIFSVVGCSLFTAHFTDLFSANILLFRMLTGDPWS